MEGKVPELAAFYNEITDYRTAEAVGVDRPQKNEILHSIPPTLETDLLDKAKLEKKIASLEGERKSFNKGKRDSETKLQLKTELAALDRKIQLELAPPQETSKEETPREIQKPPEPRSAIRL